MTQPNEKHTLLVPAALHQRRSPSKGLRFGAPVSHPFERVYRRQRPSLWYVQMGSILGITYAALMIGEPDPLFEVFRGSLCVVTDQMPNGPIHINDLKANASGAMKKRGDVAREFSRKVRSESGLNGCTFEYPVAESGGTFDRIWGQHGEGGSVLFERVESDYQNRKK
jgi:hypothetical protein